MRHCIVVRRIQNETMGVITKCRKFLVLFVLLFQNETSFAYPVIGDDIAETREIKLIPLK